MMSFVHLSFAIFLCVCKSTFFSVKAPIFPSEISNLSKFSGLYLGKEHQREHYSFLSNRSLFSTSDPRLWLQIHTELWSGLWFWILHQRQKGIWFQTCSPAPFLQPQGDRKGQPRFHSFTPLISSGISSSPFCTWEEYHLSLHLLFCLNSLGPF